MLSQKSIKTWYTVHKWTSLVCTAFLLLLCLTGLPLIFHEELDHLLGTHPEAPELPASTAMANLDAVVAQGLAQRPGEVAKFFSFDEHEPLIYLATAEAPNTHPDDSHTLVLDARTAQIIDAPPFDEGIMYILFKLHVDLFAGLPGMLFLGLMGILFVVAIISGIVVYAPFMRKLDFGTVRTTKSTRLKWLDLHNLLGIVTLAWGIVVGGTGVINTLAIPVLKFWQMGQLAEMTAPYQGLPPAQNLGSVDAAVATARQAAPDMTPAFVAYPGSDFSSDNHFAVFMRGNTPLTARLLTPALIDAETGELTDMRPMPWYVTALFVSQPLHFGDYGGMPMKIIWAVLDMITIVILGSGLYLWLGRRRTSMDERCNELVHGGDISQPAS